IQLQYLLLVFFPGISQVLLVSEGTDILRLGRKHHAFVAVAITHFPIESRVKGMKASHWGSCPCKNSYGYPDHISGHMLFFSEKTGGNIGDASHFHQFSPYILLEIHHQQRAYQNTFIIKAAQVPAFLGTYQFFRHIFQELRRRLGWKASDYISLKLPYLFRLYKAYLHVRLLSVFRQDKLKLCKLILSNPETHKVVSPGSAAYSTASLPDIRNMHILQWKASGNGYVSF